MLKNTSSSYGVGAKLFHWAVALIIITLLGVGLWMSGLDVKTTPYKFYVYGLHKSFGIVVLLLMIGRLCWRIYNTKVSPHANHKKWERSLAKIVHTLLYVLAFTMPLSGWAMSSAGGHPVNFFGLPLPALMDKNEQWGGIFRDVHEYVGYSLIGIIVLHAVGALKHHFMDRDDTLKRMFFNRKK